MNKPYVLTDDLSLVFKEYTKEIPKLQQAIDKASNIISTSLDGIFPDVRVIPGKRIFDYLDSYASDTQKVCISLTSLIPPNDTNVLSIASSRSVGLDITNNSIFSYKDVGSQARTSGAPSLPSQFQSCVEKIREMGSPSVTLLDDVVFTGGTVIKYIDELKAEGINVNSVVASVAMQKAIPRLDDISVLLKADFVYPDVVDEVCMRDFIIGAPGGGRNLLLEGGDMASVPYIYPFANIQEWASLSSDQAKGFSRDCLEASKLIWDTISPNVRFMDLEKEVFKCRPDESISDKCNQLLRDRSYEKFANTL